jgi:hypothetical protein
MNTVRRVMTCLTKGATVEDVNLVLLPCQGDCQFGHMGGDFSNSDRVQ